MRQSGNYRQMRRVMKREDRKDGWTEETKNRFIETLEATCNIAAALRAVGMSRTGLTKLRARDGEFRARMADARRRAYLDLEFFALEKMMSGTVKTVTKGDGSVETTHEFPLGLALNLLRLHRDVANGIDGEEAQGAPAEADEARRVEVIERLMRKMGKLRERMDREEAAAAAAAEQEQDEASGADGGAGEGAAEQGRDETLAADGGSGASLSAGEGAESGQ